ncbi:MAG: hypothetical protein SH847_03040 [Roseiflexaceae bacterium]|nr:hypothetical protein [Roseiflexaceae bacterium]
MQVALGLLRIVFFLIGVAMVLGTLISAVRTFVLPRSAQDFITRTVFRISRKFFDLFLKRSQTYEVRDRVLALYAPVTLMCLPVIWLAIVELGYTAIFWSMGVEPLSRALTVSGSSLLTLGFATVDNLFEVAIALSEATVGLILVALLIAYLPTMYSAFSRRELAVAMLEVRAGSPPSAIAMLERYGRIKGFDRLDALWATWEIWFAEIEESHTSLPALTFFRSPQPHRSWVTAAGTILDAAALTQSALDIPANPQASLCIRGGYVALRRIADYFRIPYPPNPKPDDPIYVSREEFDQALNRLEQAGVPLKADREQAWHDFVGWRVNYEAVLLAFCTLTVAPEAPWSSDRAPRQYGAPKIRVGE